MFDTMKMTKIAGAFCAALLVMLLGNWAASSLYSVGGGHDGDDHVGGYVIDTGEGNSDVVEVVEAVPFEVLYAMADAGEGSRLWRQCQSCHSPDAGDNGIGPYMHGIVGRAKGAVDGFSYSEILTTMGGEWTPENLNGFLESPRNYAPGTIMTYAGMRDAEDRVNLIAYLDTLDD
ncbi:MAG: cytochrome c [Paracoccaceae bacterium]|jgi:cytochrome c